MKIKIRTKKIKEAPDRLRRRAFRLLRHFRSVALRTHLVKTIKRCARMEVGRALSVLAKFTHFQLSIRPRIKLIAAVTLILIFALIGSNKGVAALRAKKPEIKVNGQAILVAQKGDESNPAPAEIESNVVAKKSPFEFVRPARGYISQGFSSYHRAIDITDDLGAPIRPLGGGRVEFVGYIADGHGNVVVIDHGDGMKSLYAHMSKINVGIGNEVTSDSTIGFVGLTGRTTGPHVHVEVNDNGIAVDPAKLLPE